MAGFVRWARRTVAMTIGAGLAISPVITPRALAQDALGQPSAPAESGAAIPLPTFLDVPQPPTDARRAPSAAQVRALRELESELQHLAREGIGFDETLRAIAARDHSRARHARERVYARRIGDEEVLETEARERAIRLLERFVSQYPSDLEHAPDAMLRLGELYYERSALQFQAASFAGAEIDRPDFEPTIALFRALASRFPDYRRIDAVHYLLGYCLDQSARTDEALAAWTQVVCASRSVDDAAPYAGCEPAVAGSELVAETWLRIGEHHFDRDLEPGALDRAIAAYRRALDAPVARLRSLALYKLAWTYYRAQRYPEAIESFALLVDESDREQARTGRAGSELRAEAMQYLAITFAYDDWNEDRVPDVAQGMASARDRVGDPRLLPQDRAWTPDVWLALGQVYFDEDRYPGAIEIWEEALRRWPMHHRAPEIVRSIARAQGRSAPLVGRPAVDDRDPARAALDRLSSYGPSSPWAIANAESHPREVARAAELAESALIDQALRLHQQAQRLSVRAPNGSDPARVAAYTGAAELYREYVDHHPNSPDLYELRYNLADALFWSERYEEAAAEYAAVRDSTLDDRFQAEAARRVVESLRHVLDASIARREVTVREAPPEDHQPLEIPEAVQRVAHAREIFLARIDEAHDREHVRPAYDFNNALLLQSYGFLDAARERFARIYEERCAGEHASAEGDQAYLALRNLAVARGDDAEVGRLAEDRIARECTFAEATTPAPGGTGSDCGTNAACIAERDLHSLELRGAVAVFREAEQLTGEPQRHAYERAATMLVRAVDRAPDGEEAPQALLFAALALERAGLWDSSSRLYERVIDEVGPRQARTDEQRALLDRVLATAWFRRGFSANRFFDTDRALEAYRVLAESARFSRSTDPEIVATRVDALINAARIREANRDFARAADDYRRVTEASTDPVILRDARFRAAEMQHQAGDWSASAREMRAFVERYRGDRDASELVVLAYARIADARRDQGRAHEHEQALRDVVTAYRELGLTSRSSAAEPAARARFELASVEARAFASFTVDAGRPATMQAYLATVQRQIRTGLEGAQRASTGFGEVVAIGRPTWAIAALVEQGAIYERVARGILNAPFVLPADLARTIRGASSAERDALRAQLEDRVRGMLDEEARPVECLAITGYALAARAARIGSVDDEHTRRAIDRLQTYGDERIGECVAAAHESDPSFAPYAPGEFARARGGQTLPMPVDVAPPALAP